MKLINSTHQKCNALKLEYKIKLFYNWTNKNVVKNRRGYRFQKYRPEVLSKVFQLYYCQHFTTSLLFNKFSHMLEARENENEFTKCTVTRPAVALAYSSKHLKRENLQFSGLYNFRELSSRVNETNDSANARISHLLNTL